uniref:Evasin n=1 Tax=Amblyomma tuberculatum TaxID=48802 RepID=A0A6M2E4J2_9ACAR
MILLDALLSYCLVYAVSCEQYTIFGGNTDWQKLPSDQGSDEHSEEGDSEIEYIEVDNPTPYDGSDEHSVEEGDIMTHEYYEFTEGPTTDGYGWMCHERLFARKGIEEKVPISCLYNCVYQNYPMVTRQFAEGAKCIHMTYADFWAYQTQVPCWIGVCEKGYCRNATRFAFCNPKI